MITQASVARALANIGLAALMGTCGISLANAQQNDSPIAIDNAWVRAMPPMQSSTAGYLSVINWGDHAVEIVAVRSQPLARVEMHQTSEVDGLMRMARIHQQSVGAGQTLEFIPGGKHLMIMDLEKMPAPGDTVELCLEFDTGNEVCALAQVRRAAPGSNDDHDKQHQHH